MRIFVAVLLILLSLFCLNQYYTLGVANAHFFSVKEQLNVWAKNNKVESNQEYTNTLNAINYVLEHDDGNPHYWHIKGKVVHWGVFAGFETPSAFNEIKSYYQTSLELRKNWPMVWSDLALVNSKLNGLSEETQSYIDQSLVYGPFEFDVLLIISEIYLANWASTTGKQKELFFESLTKLTKFGYKFSALFKLAEQYNKKTLVCTYIKYAKETANVKDSALVKRECR